MKKYLVVLFSVVMSLVAFGQGVDYFYGDVKIYGNIEVFNYDEYSSLDTTKIPFMFGDSISLEGTVLTKAKLDALLAGSYTFGNGLTETEGVVSFGGTLTQDASLKSDDGSKVGFDFSNVYGDRSILMIDVGDVYMRVAEDSKISSVSASIGSRLSSGFAANNFEVYGYENNSILTQDTTGLWYEDEPDYDLFTSEHIITKGYLNTWFDYNYLYLWDDTGDYYFDMDLEDYYRIDAVIDGICIDINDDNGGFDMAEHYAQLYVNESSLETPISWAGMDIMDNEFTFNSTNTTRILLHVHNGDSASAIMLDTTGLFYDEAMMGHDYYWENITDPMWITNKAYVDAAIIAGTLPSGGMGGELLVYNQSTTEWESIAIGLEGQVLSINSGSGINGVTWASPTSLPVASNNGDIAYYDGIDWVILDASMSTGGNILTLDGMNTPYWGESSIGDGGMDGDMLYWTSESWQSIGDAGSDGQVLVSGGGMSSPYWETRVIVNSGNNFGEILYWDDAFSSWGSMGDAGTSGQVLTSGGGMSAPEWASRTIIQDGVTTGQLSYWDGTSSYWTSMGDADEDQILVGKGSGFAPTWQDPSILEGITTGALLYWDASAWVELTDQGTSGQVLTSNGSGSNPTWTTTGGGISYPDLTQNESVDLGEYTFEMVNDLDQGLTIDSLNQYTSLRYGGVYGVGTELKLERNKIQLVSSTDSYPTTNGFIYDYTSTTPKTSMSSSDGSTYSRLELTDETGGLNISGIDIFEFDNTGITYPTLTTGFTDQHLVPKSYIDAAIAAGGASYMFENGLTETSGVVSLGGSITDNISLIGTNSNTCTIRDFSYLRLSATSGSLEFSSGYPTLTGSAGPFIRVGNVYSVEVGDYGAYSDLFRGVAYLADYSASYTDRSLPDKAYVDAAIAAGGYVPYTGATEDVDLGANNITTTGSGRFDGGIGIRTDTVGGIGLICTLSTVEDTTIGIKNMINFIDDEFVGIGIWNEFDYPSLNEYGTVRGIYNHFNVKQPGASTVGIGNVFETIGTDANVVGISQVFMGGSDGCCITPIINTFEADGLGQVINGLANIGVSSNESADISGIKNTFDCNGDQAYARGVYNIIEVNGTGSKGVGIYNNLYVAGSQASQEIIGVHNYLKPINTDDIVYGVYNTNPDFLILNDPTVFQVGTYIDWKISGTDANMKRWAFYNASTDLVAGKVFLSKDSVKTYLGTGFDASIYYNGTDLVINPKEEGIGEVSIEGGLSADSAAVDNLEVTTRIVTGALKIGDGPTLVESSSIKVAVENTEFDSLTFTNPATKWHRMADITDPVADMWIDVKYDTNIVDETTFGIEANSDSTGFVVSTDGLLFINGCGHWNWTGAANASVKIYMRVLIDGVEARCLQTNDTRGRQTSDNGTISFKGTARVEAGTTIDVQYRVSNIGMDFIGSTVFDNPIAFSVNMFKISK